MEERTYFLNIFSDYEPPEQLYDALSQAVIVYADIHPGSRSLGLSVQCPVYITDA